MQLQAIGGRGPGAVLSLLVVMLAGGCASQTTTGGQSMHTAIQVRHGVVEDVERVDLKSAAARNATIGGLAGLAVMRRGSTSEQVIGTAVGAALSALVTKAAEGENIGYSYTVRLTDGTFSKIVTEQDDIRRGDCVSVETGRTAAIRRVSAVLCEATPARPLSSDIQAHRQEEAAECQAAKEQLLKAKTGDEVNAMAAKVRVLCEH